MAKKEKFITVLDIGSSKVCCLIASPEREGITNILGYAICHHDCLKRGVVVDIKGLSEAIAKAVYEAEEISGRKVQSAFFNVTGSHIKGIASRGELIISDKDNEITKRDVDRVIENAMAIHMPFERDIIYTINKGFSVDGEKGIVRPAGMFGLKLETELFLVTAKISIIDNLKKAVRQAGIAVDGYIVSGIATGHSVLSQHEKELGVILIDIGADVTEIIVFLSGKPNSLAILPMGGDSITKAISETMRIPEGAAERLKIENGTLEEVKKAKDEKISFNMSSRKRSVSRIALNKILLSEYTKIFDAIKKELINSGYAQDASNGVVICGQPAMMDGCLEMAELILNFPVKMGHIMGLGTSPKPLPSHIYATAIGLLKYAGITKYSRKSILTMGPKNMILEAVERIQRLYHDYF